jgi:NAD(P)-dependent dehydrogenase (short-subunit alcohol dehydrogenase family)
MHFIHCDLSDLNSVRQASNRIAAKVSRIDLFLCNANAMALSPGLSKDGYEQQFAINHLSQALLIDLLIPVLEDTAALPGSDVRIILSTSRCSASKFTPKRGIDFDALRTEQSMFAGRWRRYAQSKLANLLYAKTLNKEYPGITTVCIDPGVGKMGSQTSLTSLDRFFMSFKRSSVKQLALNGLWAATAPKRQVQGGAYYGPVGVKRRLLHHQANATLEEELWDWTQEELRKWEMRAGLKARDSLSSYQS